MFSTFLSDEIRFMLVIENDSIEANSLNFRTQNSSIDWDKVRQFFEPDIVSHNEPLSHQYCTELTPKFHQFLKTFSNITPPNHLKWTNRLDLLNNVLSQRSCTLTNLLVLTSIVEYSLGNLFLTQTGGINPPHLLRDLLMTDALATLLGETTIFLLRVLLGSPNGINLRNLVWHGFPSEGEVSGLYRNFLVEMLNSIGRRLEELGFVVEFRSCLQDSKLLVRKMNLARFDVALLEEAVTSSSELQEIQRAGWLRSISLYKEKQFYCCVCMVLPQLEMFLRILYGGLYGRDFRAKIDEYYIIMDTIFEEFESVTEARSRMHDYFRIDLLEAMYDLLSAIRGPRLRDKLSHGELQWADIDEQVTNGVLLLSYVIITNDSRFEYKSCFHHNAVLQQSIRECELELDKCKDQDQNDKLVGNVPFLPQADSNDRVPIFYRPAKEEEAIGYLQRIICKLRQSTSNLNESLTLRLRALENRELRSRARKSFETMLQMFPAIQQGLRHVLAIVKWTFHCLMHADELRDADKLVKFLKFILKYVENAANNLNIKSNAWQPLYETTRRELYDKTRQNLTLLLC
ncbi:endoplasmic reticulum membrane-associated RNA degradation protein-like isoform X1 [Culex pipiens pallens]|uniref:endoplasmic reticulum membrane-associated RNA degradation protein-like isoform X1 n=1 Tax=Culex pipiens pallens TaxID=42434 RepID=UPI0022A9FDC1|nr:endoplasmic reticulum membrane-associated RNA degradation protein-like isoform X1 [Culex pipiens pallens]